AASRLRCKGPSNGVVAQVRIPRIDRDVHRVYERLLLGRIAVGHSNMLAECMFGQIRPGLRLGDASWPPEQRKLVGNGLVGSYGSERVTRNSENASPTVGVGSTSGRLRISPVKRRSRHPL